jgi:hypothetical protein
MCALITVYSYFCYFNNLWASISGKDFHLNSAEVLHQTPWLLKLNLHPCSRLPAERLVKRITIR